MDLEFYRAFGSKSNLKQNVTFYDDKTLVFISGKLCVLLDLESLAQRLLPISEGNEISTVSRYHNNLVLGLQNPPSICVFNLISETKKLYFGPLLMESNKFTMVSISVSHKFLAAVGDEPELLIVLWLCQTREIISTFKPTSAKIDSFINDISFHAGGREEVVVVGRQILRLYEYQDSGNPEEQTFSEIVYEKFENQMEYTSIAWPQKENLAIGTMSGKVYFFRGIELVKEIVVMDSLFNVVNEACLISRDLFTNLKSVSCLVTSPNELVLVFGGNIIVSYSGDEISKYEFSEILFMPKKDVAFLPGGFEGAGSIIVHLEFSASYQFIVIANLSGELSYLERCDDFDMKWKFKSLLPAQHVEPVVAMSCARGKPLLATCTKSSVVLWNYENHVQEMYLKFKDELLTLSMHPTGLYIALGFRFYTRICTVMYDGLKDRKTLKSKNCSKISFSDGGHFLALPSEEAVNIYSFITFDLLDKLKGHAGPITGIAWIANDARFVSCDARGVISGWETATWYKVWENTDVLSYTSLTVDPYNQSVIATSKENVIKCLRDGIIVGEFKFPKQITAVILSNSGTTMHFGTSNGDIGMLNLDDPNTFSEVHAHSGTIVDLVLHFDLVYLFSVGIDGSLFCWKFPGRSVYPVKYLFSNTAFVTSSDVEKHEKQLQMLQMSIQQTEMNYECDLKLNQRKYEKSMTELVYEHEECVKELNKVIYSLNEEKQELLCNCEQAVTITELENKLREKAIEQTKQLDEAYKNTDKFVGETKEKIANYKNIFKNLETSFANSWTDKMNQEDEILADIKKVEDLLQNAKKVTKNTELELDQEKEKLQAFSKEKENHLEEIQDAKLERDQSEIDFFRKERQKLNNMLDFALEDIQIKRGTMSGQIEVDTQEISKCIRVLSDELNNIENKLMAKEKLNQNLDLKFRNSKAEVEKLRRFHSVSSSAVDEVKSSIAQVESDILFAEKEIKDVTNTFLKLEEDLKLANEQCSTLNEKLKDTLKGFYQKQTQLRETQNIFSRYKFLLHRSLSPDCDAESLRQEILQVLTQHRSQSEDSLDFNLKAEFAHQIEKLQSTYKDIKADPAKVKKKWSMAVFRLSQENSKLLNEVHEIQKMVESFRERILEMEVAMGLPFSQKTKPSREMNELRDKIEMVVTSARKDRLEKRKELEQLDQLIEEQRNEILRLQNLLSEKNKEQELESAPGN